MTKTLSSPRGSRRRRDSGRPTAIVAVGIVTLIVVGVVMFVGLRAPGGLPLRHYRTVYVSFYDAGNLQPRNDVRINGVLVGQVLDLRAHNGRAVAELQLTPGTHALPADTGALLRARGLLGARYVELVPGHSSQKLDDGAMLVARPDALRSGVPETLDTFDAETRGALGTTLRALGTGLLGRGEQLNAAIHAGPRPATQFPELVNSVLARPDAVRRLAPSLDAGMTTLDAARGDIATGLRPAAEALTPFAQHGRDLGNSIALAPATLQSVREGLDAGDQLLNAAGTLARAARAVLPSAPAGLRQASVLLRESHEPLARATLLLQAARPAVAPTLTLLHRLSPVLAPARDALTYLDPLVGTLGAYGCDVDNFAENWRSALGYGVDTPDGGVQLPSGRIGPVQNFRILVIAGAQSLHDVPGTKDTLAVRDAYPRPCTDSPGSQYPLFAVDPPTRKVAR